MHKWIIVNFFKDNSIEAVPNIWFKHKICAWPKDKKIVKKYIETNVKPNKKEFLFFSARQLGNKDYDSLSEARAKLFRATFTSDLSSAEEVRTVRTPKKKEKLNTLSQIGFSKNNSLETSDFPPRFSSAFTTGNPELTPCDKEVENNKNNITFSKVDSDDSENDAVWVITDSPNQQKGSENRLLDDIIMSPSLNWEMTDENDVLFEKEINLPNGKWSVEKIKDDKVGKQIDQCHDLSHVKTLVFSEENSTTDIQDSNTDIKKDIQDLKSYMVKTLTSLKYRIDGLEILTQTIHLNIEKMIDNYKTITEHNSTISNENLVIDIDSYFPIRNDDELTTFETTISNLDIRRTLISKLSLLISGTLGNSIRRILGRMFKDDLLQTYSLLGFKKKKAFSKLQCYRLTFDIIRSNLKFRLTPEKEIDDCIAIWLSHAKFRLKKPKEVTLGYSLE